MGSSSISRKSVHILVFGVTALAAVITCLVIPELISDKQSGFYTATGFASLYGVIFAIVEILRIANATELTNVATKKVTNRINAIYGEREILECINRIEIIFDDITHGGTATPHALAKISRIYSTQFASEMIETDSEQRKRRSVLDSYVSRFNLDKTVSSAHLKLILMEILSELSTVVGKNHLLENENDTSGN